MRTADLDGAHAGHFRGLHKPFAAKVGPSVSADQLMRPVVRLDPGKEPARHARSDKVSGRGAFSRPQGRRWKRSTPRPPLLPRHPVSSAKWATDACTIAGTSVAARRNGRA
ncbi:3-deoxy-7-phosphoheptulonate synthase [Pseudofulvimonas gallinarii]|uniref:3-deoxy-7-phosphoheptulonate synthase n=1 Tax=Pseudofulvimonas gallinarii TaxID=634155 RepID=UPI000F473517|nr:3-deoxy-7-phosphoheptulonate synthase [Pseudofulvimonas gallinarii]